MTQKKNLQAILATGLFLLSIGGWLLHLKIHPPANNAANYIPFIVGLISAVVLPVMFLYRKTLHWAYVLNGMTVIIGTLTMAHFSLVKLSAPVTFKLLMLNTTFPDILMLASKFAIGKALFEISIAGDLQSPARRGHFWRYPNMGWWWVHLLGMAIVYGLGVILWP